MMHPGNEDASSFEPQISPSTDFANRRILDVLRDAWHRYPADAEVPNSAGSENDVRLVSAVMDMFSRQGLLHRAGDAVALTESGHLAISQAKWSSKGLAEFLETRTLPKGATATLSLLLAVRRAHHRVLNRS